MDDPTRRLPRAVRDRRGREHDHSGRRCPPPRRLRPPSSSTPKARGGESFGTTVSYRYLKVTEALSEHGSADELHTSFHKPCHEVRTIAQIEPKMAGEL
jgi:hypothetical protein